MGGMRKNGVGDTADVEHEVFADDAAGIGEAVGKLLVRRGEKQAGRVRAVGADYDGFCFVEWRVASFVEVDRSGGSAVVVSLDGTDGGVGGDVARCRVLAGA